MAESNTRRRRKAELILRYGAEPPAEDHADNDVEVPLGEDPADAEEEVPADAQAEGPPVKHNVIKEPEGPAEAEEEVPTAAQAEVPPDEHAVTTEPEYPAVAVQEEEAHVAKAVAGEAPGGVPTTAEDWLATIYWGTLAPVDFLPTSRLFGGAITEISGVREVA